MPAHTWNSEGNVVGTFSLSTFLWMWGIKLKSPTFTASDHWDLYGWPQTLNSPCSTSHKLGSVLPAQSPTCWGQSSPFSLPHDGLSPPCSISHVLGSVLPTQPPTCWGQSSLLSLPRAGVIGMHHYTQHNLGQLKTFQQTNLYLEGKAWKEQSN